MPPAPPVTRTRLPSRPDANASSQASIARFFHVRLRSRDGRTRPPCRAPRCSRMRRADEFRPVGDQHLAERLGGEGAVGVGDRVEPGLADAVPVASSGDAPVDHAEAEAAEAGQPADDLGVRAGPMGEELLAGQAVLAADEADAPDHGRPLVSTRRPLEQLQRDAVMDAQIGGPGAVVGAAVDVHRTFRDDRPGAEATACCHAARASSTARQRWTLPGLAVASGLALLVRRPDSRGVRGPRRRASRRRPPRWRRRDSRHACRDRACRASFASAPVRRETLPEGKRGIEVGDAHADMVHAEAVAVDPGTPAASAIVSPRRPSDPEEPLGIPREHRRLLALAEAGDDRRIGVDRRRDRN